MTKEELFGLPVGLQLRVLFEVLTKMTPKAEATLGAISKPMVPRSPKFDMRIYRKGGFQWASETNLESLQFWHKRAEESVAAGGEYAEKNEKQAKQLKYWLDYRTAEPNAPWSGERDRENVTSAAPSGKPRVHESNGPRGRPKPDDEGPSGGGGYSDQDYGSGGEDDSIQFARHEDWIR